MNIFVTGINHKTALVQQRQRFAFNDAQILEALIALKHNFSSCEFAILSTCNRVEIYSVMPAGSGLDSSDILDFLSKLSLLPSENADMLYCYNGAQAVKHLLTVTSSLDSLVVGEPQITAQVRDAYRLACQACTSGKILHRLFHCAFTTAKEVFSMTSIAQRRVSVAGVAVQLAKNLFADIKAARTLIIGAGEMGELLVRHLLDAKATDITVVNRTQTRANNLADKYNIASAPIERLNTLLNNVDIVIAAAMAEEHLFDKETLVNRSKGKPLLIIDIAVPLNFDPDVADLNDVHFHCVDDLAQVAKDNIAARQEDIQAANDIIKDNVDSFIDWFGVYDIGPLIGKLRTRFHDISKQELEKFYNAQDKLSSDIHGQIDSAVERIVNRLLHRLINNFHDHARYTNTDNVRKLIEDIIQYPDRNV
ncbi:MAG: glutamyl-tRNA reductase [Phycisphaerae bacterium]|nr:glutamyl-tRNA reductase [Phycisphaerae bacterium]